MKKTFVIIAALMLLAPFPAQASVPYLQDPVYVKINKDDEHPMQDLITLAQDGDARAQFILGDLYAKGKGGLAKNRVKARYWFEISARHGYTPAFIRLAALAKHSRDYVGAYTWYLLDAKGASGREQSWAKAEIQRLSHSLSRGAVRDAEHGASEWLGRQGIAMKEILKNEEEARRTLPPPDLGDDDKKSDKDNKDDKNAKKDGKSDDDKTAAKEAAPPRKEIHYNE